MKKTTQSPEYMYEYHWPRIISFGLIVVGGLAFALVWFFQPSQPVATTAPLKAPAQAEFVADQDEASPLVEKSDLVEAPPLMAADFSQDNLDSPVAKPTAAKPTAENPLQKAAPMPLAKASTNTGNAPQSDTETIKAANETAPDVAEEQSSLAATTSPLPPVTQQTTDTRSKAKLFTAAIKRARLTDQVRKREPGDSLPETMKVKTDDLAKVFFYTEVQGQAGTTHYHYWYHNNKLAAKVPITIGSDRWRCYSSKYLTADQTGDWHIKVKDEQGKLLAESEFVLSKDAP